MVIKFESTDYIKIWKDEVPKSFGRLVEFSAGCDL